MSEPRPETARGNLGDAPAQALRDLGEDARLAAPYELAGLIDRCARAMGARGTIAYLADLRQQVLVPFVGPSDLGEDTQPAPSTLTRHWPGGRSRLSKPTFRRQKLTAPASGCRFLLAPTGSACWM